MKELDILLSRYVDERFATAPAAEQDAFMQLLEAPDPQIYDYVVGRVQPADLPLAALIERMTGRTIDDR